MKMCKDYWYHYSDVAVNKSTAVNYVNHTTLERDTPKAPPKKVTLIESMVKPRGLFIVDGVPIPRSEVAAATRASLPTVSPLTATPTAVDATTATTAATATTIAPKASSTLALSNPRSLHSKSQTAPLRTTSSSTAPASPMHELLRSRQSAGADRTFTALMTLHNEDDVVFSGSLTKTAAATAAAPSNPTTPSHSKPPFPLWEKYPNRMATPKPEAVVQLQQYQRRQASAHYTHIYHDNNFVRAPSQSAENPFTRLVLPGYAEHRSLQKRQAIVATETSKLPLITR